MTGMLLPLALAMLAALWLARPFLSRGDVEMGETEQAISFYRGQLLELARNRREGLIDAVGQREAEREIEGRALRAARRFDGGLAVARPAPLTGALAAFLVVAGAAGTYAWLGNPGMSDQPLEARRTAALEARAESGDSRARALLAVRSLQDAPDGLDKHWALGQAYAEMGDHASAAEAYRLAAEASGDDPAVLAAYAESMTLANGNRVPQAAVLVFQQILARNPLDPRARYYAALAKAQAQDFEGALADWTALYNVSSPDAPWAARVRRDIVNMARFSGTDLATVLPDATEGERRLAATPVTPPEDATLSAEERLFALRARLEQGRDWEASIELATLLAEGGERTEALVALDAAESAYAGAPFVIEQVTAARRAITGPRNPSAAEVAAAGEMTEADRDAMIDGMVAGLAARLEQQPNDPEGWAMLLRSYVVLQRPEEARRTRDRGLAALGPETPAGRRFRAEAAEMGLAP